MAFVKQTTAPLSLLRVVLSSTAVTRATRVVKPSSSRVKTKKQLGLIFFLITFCVQKLKFQHIIDVKNEWDFTLHDVFEMMNTVHLFIPKF